MNKDSMLYFKVLLNKNSLTTLRVRVNKKLCQWLMRQTASYKYQLRNSNLLKYVNKSNCVTEKKSWRLSFNRQYWYVLGNH